MSERYLIPAAMPRSIPTSWMTVNWPSCFCSGDPTDAGRPTSLTTRLMWLRAAAAADYVLKVILTLRKASKEPFSMYSMTIITGLPANIQEHDDSRI